MHIEKNVSDNIVETLLDIEGRTKDNFNACRDLKKMGIRKDLHPTYRDGRWYYPATFILYHEMISLKYASS